MTKISSLDNGTSNQIVQMRLQIDNIVNALIDDAIIRGHENMMNERELRSLANKLLHKPMVELRRGNLVSQKEIEDVTTKIETQLREHQHSATQANQKVNNRERFKC